jgi:RimJ/RimL family protein N-acetyltransferase
VIVATDYLELRYYDGDHGERLETMAEWLNDPEIVRYSEQRHRQHDWESQLQYILNHPGVFREIHAGDRFIGTISAYIDRPNGVADVGILIGDKSVWGHGYGTKAWTMFCDALFKNGIRKVEAGAMNLNSRMIGIFRRSGMHFEAYRENHFLLDGEPVHMVMWGKLAP